MGQETISHPDLPGAIESFRNVQMISRNGMQKYNNQDHSRFLLILYSLVYGAIMLSLNGRSPSELYSVTPYHRYQAVALLHGHFRLADSIDALQPGLAWHNSEVQQVWGLGVGLWLVPFQAVWQIFGGQIFPDRLALGIALALLAVYAGSTGLRITREGQREFGLGLIWLITLCPALWILARASTLIFEETILYAIILSLGILVSMVRLVFFGSRADYFLCCFFGAFAAWVRPTHAIYGLIGLLVGSLLFWRRERKVKAIALGTALWFASVGLLAWTNNVRFGSPTEFGHRLTVSTGSMVYLTRFGNPFREATPVNTVRELFGMLFLNPNVRGTGAFADNLFPGQSAITRWRRLDLTTFDRSYAALGFITVAWAALSLSKRWTKQLFRAQPFHALTVPLLAWSIISALSLGWFYLYYPAIASRYLLDFAPALTGVVTVAWAYVSRHWRKLSLPLLAIWLVCELVTAKVPADSRELPSPRNPSTEIIVSRAQGTFLKDFNGTYTIDHHPAETRILGNGYGWDADGGFAASVVSVAIDQPEFVEVRVEKRRALYGALPEKDVYRAQIDGLCLPLRYIANETEGLRIVFDVPPEIRSRHQDEMLFLCFSERYDPEDRGSQRILHSIRWR
jgi:hypothetical protein